MKTTAWHFGPIVEPEGIEPANAQRWSCWRVRCNALGSKMNATNATLSRLYDAEVAMARRAARVGARLELPASAMWLLQLASHADAALDDLGGFADGREATLQGGASVARTWGRGVMAWLGDLVPGDAAGVYRSIAADMRRDLDLACELRAAATAARDLRLAAWCALWIEQRTGLADHLVASLADGAPARAGVLAETAVR